MAGVLSAENNWRAEEGEFANEREVLEERPQIYRSRARRTFGKKGRRPPLQEASASKVYDDGDLTATETARLAHPAGG